MVLHLVSTETIKICSTSSFIVTEERKKVNKNKNVISKGYNKDNCVDDTFIRYTFVCVGKLILGMCFLEGIYSTTAFYCLTHSQELLLLLLLRLLSRVLCDKQPLNVLFIP